MGEYVILTDSGCDLPYNMILEANIEIIPMSFVMDGKTYWHYPDNREMSIDEFYQKIAEGKVPSTNAINPSQASDAIEAYLKDEKDVLLLSFSSGLSTTYHTYQMVAEDLSAQYPDRKVFAVDTVCASLGQGMLVWQAAKLRNQGKSIEEVRDWVNERKLHLCHWFTVNDLFYLKRGGRVSAATAVMGTMLQVKPILHMDEEGHLLNVGKARGRKAALMAIVDKMDELGIKIQQQDPMFVCHSYCPEDAQFLADEIKKRYGTKEVIVSCIGPVIGSHTGIGCAAVFFYGEHR